MRKNARARGWVSKRVERLRREGYPHRQSVGMALEEARGHRLVNSAEAKELEGELMEAEEVASGFHGRPSREVVEEVEDHEYRSELAQLGELVELEVACFHLPEMVVLEFERKDPVRLASSHDRKQLFLVGGDQAIDNSTIDLMARAGADKDKVVLGYVFSVSYFADKHHLTGPKQQKQGTEYIHEFGEQSFKRGSVEERIAGGALPELIYDRLNRNLLFVGGGYQVRDEGIWD